MFIYIRLAPAPKMARPAYHWARSLAQFSHGYMLVPKITDPHPTIHREPHFCTSHLHIPGLALDVEQAQVRMITERYTGDGVAQPPVP